MWIIWRNFKLQLILIIGDDFNDIDYINAWFNTMYLAH